MRKIGLSVARQHPSHQDHWSGLRSAIIALSIPYDDDDDDSSDNRSCQAILCQEHLEAYVHGEYIGNDTRTNPESFARSQRLSTSE